MAVDDASEAVARGTAHFSELFKFPQKKIRITVPLVGTGIQESIVGFGVIECWFQLCCSLGLISSYMQRRTANKVIQLRLWSRIFQYVIWRTASDILEMASFPKMLVCICQTARCHISQKTVSFIMRNSMYCLQIVKANIYPSLLTAIYYCWDLATRLKWSCFCCIWEVHCWDVSWYTGCADSGTCCSQSFQAYTRRVAQIV